MIFFLFSNGCQFYSVSIEDQPDLERYNLSEFQHLYRALPLQVFILGENKNKILNFSMPKQTMPHGNRNDDSD